MGYGVTKEMGTMSDTTYEERIVRTIEAFRKNRYEVSRFAERTAAADYLAREIRGKRVGFGDSETLRALSLYERLSVHNEVIDPPRAGHVGGINKLVPDIEAGIDRIHNIAAPRNAHRKGKKTPCAAGDRCYDCAALERICNALTIHYKKMSYRPMELVLIEEELGL